MNPLVGRLMEAVAMLCLAGLLVALITGALAIFTTR